MRTSVFQELAVVSIDTALDAQDYSPETCHALCAEFLSYLQRLNIRSLSEENTIYGYLSKFVKTKCKESFIGLECYMRADPFSLGQHFLKLSDEKNTEALRYFYKFKDYCDEYSNRPKAKASLG